MGKAKREVINLKKANKYLSSDEVTEEIIKCSKCGRGSIVLDSNGKVFKTLTLTAVRGVSGFNCVSGKCHKGAVKEYVCNECKEIHRGKRI